MEEIKVSSAQLAAMANAKVEGDASGNVTISAAALQRIYDHLQQLERDARIVSAEHRHLVYSQGACEAAPMISLVKISKAAYRMAEDSTAALVKMQLDVPFVGDPFMLNSFVSSAEKHSVKDCKCCEENVILLAASNRIKYAPTPAPAPASDAEEEDLYA